MTSDIEKAGMMDVVDRTANEQRQWPTPLQAAFNALPADGSPAPLAALLTALQRQSPGWSVAGVREALAGLVAAGRAYHWQGEGWSRGVPEGWGLRYDQTGCVDVVRDGKPLSYQIASIRRNGHWTIFRSEESCDEIAKGKGGVQAAVRACWERGLFGPVAVAAAGPRPITRAEKWTTIGAIGEALRVPRIGVSLHFGHDDALKSIALPVTGGERDLTVTERATLARAGIVPGPEGWCWAAGAGDPVAEVTPAPHFDEEPEIQHTIACDNTGGELCDCADYPPPPPVAADGRAVVSVVPSEDDRAQRIRDALIEGLSRGPHETAHLRGALSAMALGPITTTELRAHLASIGAVEQDGRWRLSDGPPPGWGWRSGGGGDYTLLYPVECERGSIGWIAAAYPNGAWRAMRGDDVIARGDATPTDLPSAQSAALLAARRAGLFAPPVTPAPAKSAPTLLDLLAPSDDSLIAKGRRTRFAVAIEALSAGIEERAVRACLDRLDERVARGAQLRAEAAERRAQEEIDRAARAEAERDAARAEVERLRAALAAAQPTPAPAWTEPASEED